MPQMLQGSDDILYVNLNYISYNQLKGSLITDNWCNLCIIISVL